MLRDWEKRRRKRKAYEKKKKKKIWEMRSRQVQCHPVRRCLLIIVFPKASPRTREKIQDYCLRRSDT
ncbi:hypothetical protein L596_022468 [Steinernema carpocapsae]|uniref:Uncharacterized protein n=1 Tax=Steinernema carpocapsae TaxID=34508 RepID=A0A4U5MLU4_STECR|nr:hypothetical protein L596_022468 [Steinernema carpocapsae]